MKVRILWSGITGRTGIQAKIAAEECEYAEVVAGISRSNRDYYNYDELSKIQEQFDVIVDFSHKDSFDKILTFAIKVRKPLIIGTAALAEYQRKNIEQASHVIPIFGGGNFMFGVEKFITEIINLAKTKDEIKIVERHYKTKKIPSDTAKAIVRRVKQETGKETTIESFLEYDDEINDWQVGELRHVVKNARQIIGHDILKIAKLMTKQKPGLYYLEDLLK